MDENARAIENIQKADKQKKEIKGLGDITVVEDSAWFNKNKKNGDIDTEEAKETELLDEPYIESIKESRKESFEEPVVELAEKFDELSSTNDSDVVEEIKSEKKTVGNIFKFSTPISTQNKKTEKSTVQPTINYEEYIKKLIDSCNNHLNNLKEIDNIYKNYYYKTKTNNYELTKSFNTLFDKYIKEIEKDRQHLYEGTNRNNINKRIIKYFENTNYYYENNNEIINKLNDFKNNVIQNVENIKNLLNDNKKNKKDIDNIHQKYLNIENNYIKEFIKFEKNEENKKIIEKNSAITINSFINVNYYNIANKVDELKKQKIQNTTTGGRHRKSKKCVKKTKRKSRKSKKSNKKRKHLTTKKHK